MGACRLYRGEYSGFRVFSRGSLENGCEGVDILYSSGVSHIACTGVAEGGGLFTPLTKISYEGRI